MAEQARPQGMRTTGRRTEAKKIFWWSKRQADSDTVARGRVRKVGLEVRWRWVELRSRPRLLGMDRGFV